MLRPEIMERLDEALEEAEVAFWEQIAKAFPEATTGDLDPPAAIAFSEAELRVGRAWVIANVPGALVDEGPE